MLLSEAVNMDDMRGQMLISPGFHLSTRTSEKGKARVCLLLIIQSVLYTVQPVFLQT